MMKLPNCPICDEPDLWVKTGEKVLILSCKECGWQGDIKLPIAIDSLRSEIAKVVAAARKPEPRHEWHRSGGEAK